MKQNSILQKSGWWILSILSIIPLAFWIFEAPLSVRFGSLSFFARSLGDAFGLCGIAMFSLVMILSARLKFFERFFNGINDSYMAHHFFGGLTLCLLLFHPLFLAYNFLKISFTAAALFLLPSANNWPLNYGFIGLLVMIVTLVITFYTSLKYQVWKFTHKFLGLAYIFALLHTFLIGPDVSSNYPLRVYLFVLGAAGLATYFYRTLFADYFVRIFNYKVIGVKGYEDKIWEIEFAPLGREIKFAPGQFGFLKLYSKEITKESHPFSFSSPSGNPLKIAVKELGDWTNKIGNIKPGDTAALEGPFGAFSFRNFSNKNQIWIGGGIGITPFLSMLGDLKAKDSEFNIDLYYSVKSENCLAFKQEIEEIAKTNKNLNIRFWVADKMGFLTAEKIKTEIADISEKDVLICGPGLMMNALKEQLISQGLHEKQIHMEEFQLY